MNVQGKWGYYPCDWETYRKLKAINLAYFKALKSKRRWERWDAKDPKNRICRGKLKDSSGKVVGYQAPHPMPEPEICPIFCKKVTKKVFQDRYGKYDKKGFDVSYIEIEDSPYEDYRNARYPKATAEEVKPLFMSMDRINRLSSLVS